MDKEDSTNPIAPKRRFGIMSSESHDMQGMGLGNLSVTFSKHRHDGGPAAGETLFGPYLMRDTLNGKTYRLDIVNGVLTPVQVAP